MRKSRKPLLIILVLITLIGTLFLVNLGSVSSNSNNSFWNSNLAIDNDVTEPPCEGNEPEVEITGLVEDETYSGTITIKISITDESSIKEASIIIINDEVEKSDYIELELEAGTWIGSYELNTTVFPDGTYLITFEVLDDCDNSAKVQFEVIFDNAGEECDDNDPPEVEIKGIEDEETYSGTITIEVTVTDESDIDKATIEIEDGDISEKDEIDLDLKAGTWTGSYDLDTTDFPDDTYDITIEVYDECDNVKRIRLDVTFDNGITTGEGPSPTPGFEGISVFLSLGTIAAVLCQQRRKK
ncbi:MAG: Ig-like domain repeat protein [Promethearchaeota archaeon]